MSEPGSGQIVSSHLLKLVLGVLSLTALAMLACSGSDGRVGVDSCGAARNVLHPAYLRTPGPWRSAAHCRVEHAGADLNTSADSHAQSYLHARTNAYATAYAYPHAQSYLHARTNAYATAYAYPHAQSDRHTSTDTNAQSNGHACADGHTVPNLHAIPYTSTHVYAAAHVHACAYYHARRK